MALLLMVLMMTLRSLVPSDYCLVLGTADYDEIDEDESGDDRRWVKGNLETKDVVERNEFMIILNTKTSLFPVLRVSLPYRLSTTFYLHRRLGRSETFWVTKRRTIYWVPIRIVIRIGTPIY